MTPSVLLGAPTQVFLGIPYGSSCGFMNDLLRSAFFVALKQCQGQLEEA